MGNEQHSGWPSGSSFRRVGATLAVACAVTGSLVGLGAVGALAAPDTTTAKQSATPMPKATAPKVTYTAADLAAFIASPYAGDALQLAVVWGTPDTETAKGKAGAKLRAGTALPFAAADVAAYPFTPDQEQTAFFMSGVGDYRQALGLAVAWGSDDVYAVKSKLGGKILTGQALPTAPATYTEDQEVAAFTASGYTDDDGARLAALWQSPSTRSAEARAGQALLAGQSLPI